jgi:hypothetical protein
MASTSLAAAPRDRYELWFASLHREGRALAFPCDASGLVDCDDLTDRARDNYFYARSTVGRDFASPSVIPIDTRRVA